VVAYVRTVKTAFGGATNRSPRPNAVDGRAPVKRNRYIQLSGATKSVNRTLEAKTRALAGWKGYTTNLVGQPASFVIGAYHQLWVPLDVPSTSHYRRTNNDSKSATWPPYRLVYFSTTAFLSDVDVDEVGAIGRRCTSQHFVVEDDGVDRYGLT
jgi:hypothetical protein